MSASNFWLNALSTLLGAAAGAAVSGFIAFKIFKRGSKERDKARAGESAERATSRALLTQENYEVRFTQVLAKLLEEIGLYADSLQPGNVANASRGDIPLDTAICVAQIVAKGQDLEMIQVTRRAFLANRRRISREDLLTKLSGLSSELTQWRTGAHDPKQHYKRIERYTNEKDSDPT